MILSIIVPTYNVENYLSNCLDSLLNQDLSPHDYEIIVVNDGSTDASKEIAVNYEKKHTQIRLFSQQNQGLSAARNQGVKLAKGEYIYFVDSDDYIAANTLGYLISQTNDYDLEILRFGFRQTSDLNIRNASNYEIIGTEELKVSDGITFVAENPIPDCSVWIYFIKRDYLLGLGCTFPIGRFHEDYTFSMAVFANSQRIANSSLDVYRYVKRPDSITTKHSKQHSLKVIDSQIKNITDMQALLDWVSKSSHTHAGQFRDNIEALQHFLVFQILVVSLRARISKEEVAPIIEEITSLGLYPMNKGFLKTNNNLGYSLMRVTMNQKKLFFIILNLFGWLDKTIPGFQGKLNRCVKRLTRIKIQLNMLLLFCLNGF